MACLERISPAVMFPPRRRTGKPEWAAFVRQARRRLRLRQRGLAARAGVDPSYITLIERDGCVPRREKVVEIARALGVDVDQALLIAGYAPQEVELEVLLERAEARKVERLAERLDPGGRRVVHLLASLPRDEQRRVAQVVEAYVQVLRNSG